MNHPSNNHRLLIFLFLAFTLCALLIQFFYSIVGHKLILAIYEERFPLSWVNALIDARELNTVRIYYEKIDKLFTIFLIGLAFTFVILAVVLLRKWWILGSLLALTVLFEIFLVYLSHNPQAFLRATRTFLSPVYLYWYMPMCQWDPQISRYDPELQYTFSPGIWEFDGLEFRTQLAINSLGVRDDEQSLREPEIIIIGDSFAMGWGIHKQETYERLLEQATDMPALNTAISSYGTAREIRMLDRVDVSRMQYLIIHYFNNDIYENYFFHIKRNTIPFIDEKRYILSLQDPVPDFAVYYPGKRLLDYLRRVYLYYVLPLPAINPDEAAWLFLNALRFSDRINLDSVQIIVLGKTKFIQQVNETIAKGRYPDHITSMHFVDITNILENPDCTFPIDTHLNALGHSQIAERLIPLIKNRK
jgi:hypothetical protein